MVKGKKTPKVFSIKLHKKPGHKRVAQPAVVKRIRILGSVKPEVAFYLIDGRRLDTLLHVVDALETMSEDIFRHHVNDMRNDFATWINDVYNEKELADMLKNCFDRRSTQVTILRHMVEKLKKFV